jgi:hypothetical protein
VDKADSQNLNVMFVVSIGIGEDLHRKAGLNYFREESSFYALSGFTVDVGSCIKAHDGDI